MRLLILTQYFPPEIGAPQTRLQAMSSELKRLGHEVEVVTALPNYPRGRFLSGYEHSLYRRESRDGVEIQRVWLYAAMGGGFKRILNYLSFTITSCFCLLRAKRPDYMFVESPPLSLAVPGCIFARHWGVPLIFNVADLWPDSAVELGFLKSRTLIQMLSGLERWSYRKAAFVNATAEGVQDSLIQEKGVPPEKILFLPNGVDTIRFQPRAADASLKHKLGLETKKVVLYQGTLGHAHGLDVVLHAAKLLEDHRELHFLFVGDGSDRLRLEKLREFLELRNLTFHDPVSLEQLPTYFSIAECGIVSLRANPVFDGTRPAKMFPILASGKPILFVGQGEAARLVERANAGIVVAQNDAQALADAVLKLLENRGLATEFGRNGRRFVEENLQWSNLVADWLAQLTQAHARDEANATAMCAHDAQPADRRC